MKKLEEEKCKKPLDIYLTDIHRVNPLSKEEEIELGKKIQEAKKIYENSPSTNGRNGKYKKFCELRNQLVEHNLGLVVIIAKYFRGNGLDYSDLIQEGNNALIDCAEKYDYTYGYKFTSYATENIKGRIKRALTNYSRTIRVPSRKTKNKFKIDKIVNELFVKLNRKPTLEEISKEMNLEVKYIKKILNSFKTIRSLDEPVLTDRNKPKSLADLIKNNSPSVSENIELQEFKKGVRKNLTIVPVLERRMIRKKFGFYGKIHTFAEIGNGFGMTHQGAEGRINKAKRKLRHSSRMRAFVDYLN